VPALLRAAVLALVAAAVAAGPAHAIVGGGPLSPTTFTARHHGLVAIMFDGRELVCGGALASSGTVVTGAHCVIDRRTGQLLDPVRLSVVAGRHDRTSATGEELSVESVTRHPGYDGGRLRYDVAVLQLYTAPRARPVRLVQPGERALWGGGAGRGMTADGPFVAGWGATTPGGPPSATPNEMPMPIGSDGTCSGPLPGFGEFYDPATMLCGGSAGPGAPRSCAGDSGGPVVAGDRVIALISFNAECGHTLYEGLVRVDAVRGWLEPRLREARPASPPAWRVVESAALPQPVGVRVVRVSRTSVALRWRAGGGDISRLIGFEVYRESAAGWERALRTERPAGTITRLRPGRRYRFAIVSRARSGGRSVPSPAYAVRTRR
jgi:trypsin